MVLLILGHGAFITPALGQDQRARDTWMRKVDYDIASMYNMTLRPSERDSRYVLSMNSSIKDNPAVRNVGPDFRAPDAFDQTEVSAILVFNDSTNFDQLRQFRFELAHARPRFETV